MEAPRVSLKQAVPELYQAMIALERAMSRHAAAAGIASGFAHLLRLRASQINGCAFCLRMHQRDALEAGESTDRIAVLPAWRETGYFDEKERAALALVEAVTLLPEGQVPDEIYEASAEVLSREEIAAVEWLAIVINSWNRMAVSSRTPVGPEE